MNESLKLFPQAQIVEVFMKVLNLKRNPTFLGKILGIEKDDKVVIFQK